MNELLDKTEFFCIFCIKPVICSKIDYEVYNTIKGYEESANQFLYWKFFSIDLIKN